MYIVTMFIVFHKGSHFIPKGAAVKKYVIKIDGDLAVFFEHIAKAAGRDVEDVLADTLYKMAEILLREVDKDLPV